ncbi:MAG: thiol reductase thioredoxin [Myxococcales bacterium]|nr:thiol reductase thioredoxin [Myxococcales bacterium]
MIHANDETFDREVGTGDVPVLVDFSASWCGPCRRLGEVLPAIAQKFAGKVKVVKVDVDESPKVSARYVDEGVPTLVVFQRGKPVAMDCGFGTRRETEKWLEAALKQAAKPGSKKPRRPACCRG